MGRKSNKGFWPSKRYREAGFWSIGMWRVSAREKTKALICECWQEDAGVCVCARILGKLFLTHIHHTPYTAHVYKSKDNSIAQKTKGWKLMR